MSANVKFDNVGASGGGGAAAPVAMILPYDILTGLQGRRVTALLSAPGGEELEGTLGTVDLERGDMVLTDVRHYRWAAEAGARADDAHAAEQWAPVAGGGFRALIKESKTVMVNSRFVEVITPAVFDSTA